jgi:hypothetical protein
MNMPHYTYLCSLHDEPKTFVLRPPHLNVIKCPGFWFLKNGILLGFLSLEDGTDGLSQNVGKEKSLLT